MAKEIIVTQNPEEVVAPEILAAEILKISKAMKSFSASRITRYTIVTLISSHSKVSKKNIELVLNNLEHLEAIWLKPLKK